MGLLNAVDVGGDWLARWDAVKASLEYVNIESGRAVGTPEECREVDAIDAAPDPGRHVLLPRPFPAVCLGPSFCLLARLLGCLSGDRC